MFLDQSQLLELESWHWAKKAKLLIENCVCIDPLAAELLVKGIQGVILTSIWGSIVRFYPIGPLYISTPMLINSTRKGIENALLLAWAMDSP